MPTSLGYIVPLTRGSWPRRPAAVLGTDKLQRSAALDFPWATRISTHGVVSRRCPGRRDHLRSNDSFPWSRVPINKKRELFTGVRAAVSRFVARLPGLSPEPGIGMLADLPFTDSRGDGRNHQHRRFAKSRAVGVGPPDPCTTAGDMETFSTLVLTDCM